jgi:hypothetical protein
MHPYPRPRPHRETALAEVTTWCKMRPDSAEKKHQEKENPHVSHAPSDGRTDTTGAEPATLLSGDFRWLKRHYILLQGREEIPIPPVPSRAHQTPAQQDGYPRNADTQLFCLQSRL